MRTQPAAAASGGGKRATKRKAAAVGAAEGGGSGRASRKKAAAPAPSGKGKAAKAAAAKGKGKAKAKPPAKKSDKALPSVGVSATARLIPLGCAFTPALCFMQSKVWVGFEALGEFLGDVRKVDAKGGRFFAFFEADGESMWIEQHNKWRMG